MSKLYGGNPSAVTTETRGGASTARAVYGSRLPGVAALLVFCLFAASALALLTFGVSAYYNISETPRQGYEERAGLSYVWTKIKHADAAGQVYLGELEGIPALCLGETIGDRVYVTMLYQYEGNLCELFAEAGFSFRPDAGVPVVPGGSLQLEALDGGLIRVTSGERSLYIAPRANGHAEGGLEL